ncbi:MAG: histidine kinase dimerization/phosphoacceptor domain -containing protein [Balneolaceae bacterium]|nr:histidine kinase dimerization/phosphoacceptor domain -containing protein [Balneolaceae bacterium]
MKYLLSILSRHREGVVLGWLVLAAVWIFGTDHLIALLSGGAALGFWPAFKDWLFFGITGSLLLVVIGSFGRLLGGIKDDQARMRQAIMDLGKKAIVSEDLSEFFHPLADFLAELLSVDEVTIFRYLEDQQGLDVISATHRELLESNGPARLEREEGRKLFTMNKTTLLEDRRYAEITEWLTESLQRSLLPVAGVVIPGEERPLGLILLHSDSKRNLGVSNTLFLKAIAHLIANTVVRKNIEDDLKKSLDEKQLLLSEIHHRVKNNLAIVSGLLELQLEEKEDPQLRHALKDSQRRIHSMAMIHEQLYTSEDFSDVGFKEYLGSLLGSIRRTYGEEGERITLVTHIGDVRLDLDRAIPMGLVVTELVSNAFKHAYTAREAGAVTVELEEKDGEIRLRVADDGSGLPGDFDLEQTSSLGMKLVETLSTQLNGSLTCRNMEKGCEFLVAFPR